MARIYTRTGDDGTTHLGDGSRDRKCADRIALYGEVDELNSVLGCAVAALRRVGLEGLGTLVQDLQDIQSRLFDLGAVLAHPGKSAEWAGDPAAGHDFGAAELEKLIDRLDANLAPLKNFILPGGQEGAALLHLARAVCRRVERQAVELAAREPVPAGAVVFLNRLSDFLFTAARAANAAAGVRDIPWVGQSKGA
ncbi:cob(I)yrinic acid a,c-diamide adenosyltransferase [bacterium]|nr:cob(I)yrinic acid a,c-diamide adenosyltransferase [bacterium]